MYFHLDNIPPISAKVISIDKTDTLSNILAKDLSNEKCRLLSSKKFKDQRITIYLNKIEQSKISDILITALSHPDTTRDTPPLFEWHRGVEDRTFIFTSNATYLKTENHFLEFPLRQLRRTLTISRDDIRSGANEASSGLSIAFHIKNNSVLSRAISSLSDSQIEEMANGKSIDISNSIPKPNVDLYNQMWNSMLEKTDKELRGKNHKIPFSKPILRLEKSDENDICFNLMVHGALDGPAPAGIVWNNTGITFDPFMYQDKADSPLSGRIDWLSKIPNDTMLDLSDMYASSSKIDLTNSGQVLRYIAQKANINLVCEQFNFKDINSQKSEKYKFSLKKGTLRDVFSIFWRNLNIKCIIKDHIYYIWSPKWAFERRCDMTDEEINKYKNIYSINSGYTVSNLKDIAAKFNDFQIYQTLSPELNLTMYEKANFSKMSLAFLRFLSKCPSEVLTNAQRSSNPLSNNPAFGGIIWSDVPSWLRTELDISSGQDGKTLEPKIEFTFQDIMYAQGKLYINRRVEDGFLTERAMLGIRRQDGESIFGASIMARTKAPKTKSN